MLAYLGRFVPDSILSYLFKVWPPEQVQVLSELMRSPGVVYACLDMAHDEMNRIREMDVDLLRGNCALLRFYFARHDNWVDAQRDTILAVLGTTMDSTQITLGEDGIPHSFCISK